MSATFEIKSDNIDKILADVDQLGGAISGDDVKLVMGRAVRNVIVDHFTKLANDAEHHKTADALGARPTGVYQQAAQNTSQPEVDSEGVSISVHQVAIAQRFFGGPIQPVSAKFLTIPARTEAYGKRPREFENLRAIIFRSGAGALVAKEGGATVRGAHGGRKTIGDSEGGVYFWLVKQVTQPPDPSVLPNEDEMLDAATRNAKDYISKIWSK